MGASVSSLDWSSIGANIGVFLGAASALFIGIKSGLKKIAKGEIEPAPTATKKAVAAATLIETTSLLMWSESNRDVVDALNRVERTLTSMMERIDIIDDLNKEARELRHQIERLRDKMT
jgi:gas vesicle protein